MASKGGYYIEHERNGSKQLAEVHYGDQTKNTIGSGKIIVRLIDKDYKPQFDHLKKQHRVFVDQSVTRKMGFFD